MDGDTCVCYARKTANWYYFSDKMDFRIQLAGDNRTITKQEWRRKHYDSSWYESGLLDYVDLMTFGEPYLQTELNPIRQDIINNYNTYLNFVENNYNFGYEDGQPGLGNGISEIIANLVALFRNDQNIVDSIINLREQVQHICENWNSAWQRLAELLNFTVSTFSDNKLIDNKEVSTDVLQRNDFFWHDCHPDPFESSNLYRYSSGVIMDTPNILLEVKDGPWKALHEWATAVIGQDFSDTGGGGAGRTLINQIEALDTRLTALESRVSSLESKI